MGLKNSRNCVGMCAVGDEVQDTETQHHQAQGNDRSNDLSDLLYINP